MKNMKQPDWRLVCLCVLSVVVILVGGCSGARKDGQSPGAVPAQTQLSSFEGALEAILRKEIREVPAVKARGEFETSADFEARKQREHAEHIAATAAFWRSRDDVRWVEVVPSLCRYDLDNGVYHISHTLSLQESARWLNQYQIPNFAIHGTPTDVDAGERRGYIGVDVRLSMRVPVDQAKEIRAKADSASRLECRYTADFSPTAAAPPGVHLRDDGRVVMSSGATGSGNVLAFRVASVEFVADGEVLYTWE